MVEIILKMPGQPDSPLSIPPGQYQVGSSEAVAIQLPFVGVSKLHCVLQAQESSLRVADLGSSNGTYLNGQRIGREFVNVPSDSDIEIGSVHIRVGKLTPEMKPVRTSSAPPSPVTDDPEAQFKSRILAVSGIPMSARPLVQEIKKQAHSELLLRLNMKRLALGNVSESDLEEKARTTIHEILNELSIPLPEGVTQEKIENELYHEAIGLGPLEDLIARDDITEIMVNGPDNVYVEHKGVLYKTDTAFADDHQVVAAIERIVSPLGRRIDESSPMVDARLKDGSRVNAIIPPLALDGPSITIRKFAKTPLTVENLISYGSITAEIAHFLDVCVKIRKNILISGGTGSGKTTLLNILSGFLPNKERIITIEDAAELQLRQEHLVRLESRPANIEGKGEVTIRDLVRNSLRMRPDRIVIGECRGGEALDMLQAMNTGHQAMSTGHANSAQDMLSRIETMVLMGMEIPLPAVRGQIASGIDIVIHLGRLRDRTRKVLEICELEKELDSQSGRIKVNTLFRFEEEKEDEKGKIVAKWRKVGELKATEKLVAAGLSLPQGD